MAGTQYRQRAWRLRLDQGPGKPDRLSERPAILDEDGRPARWLDEDDEGRSTTLVSEAELKRAGFNIAFGLKTEQIAEMEQPKREPAKAPKPTRQRKAAD